jgi:hypothetical protein
MVSRRVFGDDEFDMLSICKRMRDPRGLMSAPIDAALRCVCFSPRFDGLEFSQAAAASGVPMLCTYPQRIDTSAGAMTNTNKAARIQSSCHHGQKETTQHILEHVESHLQNIKQQQRTRNPKPNINEMIGPLFSYFFRSFA